MSNAYAAKMPEDELQQLVADLCAHLALPHFHVRNPIGMTKGWPDSVIIGPRRVLYRELKSSYGKLSPEQRDISYRLIAAGCDFAVWRPEHWLRGTIRQELLLLKGQPELPLTG